MMDKEISWFEWDKLFGPIERIEEYNDPRLAQEEAQKYIWTELDCDGEVIIGSGWHYVNRLAYYISRVAVPNGMFITVVDDELGGELDEAEEQVRDDSCGNDCSTQNDAS